MCGQVMLHHPLLRLVRALVEDKGDGSIPAGLQHLVPQALLVEAVVPLREVTGAVGLLSRGPSLPPVHTAATAEPTSTTRGSQRGGFMHGTQV